MMMTLAPTSSSSRSRGLPVRCGSTMGNVEPMLSSRSSPIMILGTSALEPITATASVRASARMEDLTAATLSPLADALESPISRSTCRRWRSSPSRRQQTFVSTYLFSDARYAARSTSTPSFQTDTILRLSRISTVGSPWTSSKSARFPATI